MAFPKKRDSGIESTVPDTLDRIDALILRLNDALEDIKVMLEALPPKK